MIAMVKFLIGKLLFQILRQMVAAVLFFAWDFGVDWRKYSIQMSELYFEVNTRCPCGQYLAGEFMNQQIQFSGSIFADVVLHCASVIYCNLWKQLLQVQN